MFFLKRKIPQIPKEKINKILLVRPDALGDMVLMIPVLKAIRKKHPQAHITVLASKYNSMVIQHLPYMDDIIYKEDIQPIKSFFKRVMFLKQYQFDVAVHFGIRDYIVWPSFFAIPYNLGDKALLSLWPIFRKYGVFYRSHDRPRHVCEYHFIIAQALGITLHDVENLNMEPPSGTAEEGKQVLVEMGKHSDRPLIGIHVGVGYGNRPIKPEKYAEYINQLRESLSVDVCLTAYADKEFEACRVIESLVNDPVFILEKRSLDKFMGVIKWFDLYVSVDTGPFHISAALGVPQLAIFPSKKVKPLSWGPFRNRHYVIRQNLNCLYDCPHQGCPYDICSDDIKVSEMVEKTVALLNGAGVVTRKDQIEHWFTLCMSILILFDKETMSDAEQLFNQLRGWGLNVYSKPIDDPHIFECMRQRDIAIVHNLTGKREVKLFLMGQRVIKYIYHPPLFIHDIEHFESKDELLEFYISKFKYKIL